MTLADKQTELADILMMLNDDEREAVIGVALKSARRMMLGREQYGPLDLSRDPRDFYGEAAEESVDQNLYFEFEAIKRSRR